MYSGKLQIKDDRQLQEAIAVSDYLQMTALKNALDLKAKHRAVPGTVLGWSMFADTYNLPHLTDMCDRIQVLKFREVVKHEEFLQLSKDDIAKYFKKCEQYSGTSHDDLLKAVLAWTERNEQWPELIQPIMKKCSQSLNDMVNHPPMAKLKHLQTEQSRTNNLREQSLTYQDSEDQIFSHENCCVKSAIKENPHNQSPTDKKPQRQPLMLSKSKDSSKLQQTLAYRTSDKCLLVDEDGGLREFKPTCWYDWTPDNPHSICRTDQGFDIWIKDTSTGCDIVETTLYKYTTTDGRIKKISDKYNRKPGIELSIFHHNNLYIIPSATSKFMVCYNMDKNEWSLILLPAQVHGVTAWRAAAIRNNLFFMNSKLNLYRLTSGHLEKMETKINRSFPVKTFTMNAIHNWLYFIMLHTGKITTYCYNPAANLWTTVNSSLKGLLPRSLDSATVFGNKIYATGCNFLGSTMFEYNLATDCLTPSTRPMPRDKFVPFVVDVDPRMLKASSPLPYYVEHSSSDTDSGQDSHPETLACPIMNTK